MPSNFELIKDFCEVVTYGVVLRSDLDPDDEQELDRVLAVIHDELQAALLGDSYLTHRQALADGQMQPKAFIQLVIEACLCKTQMHKAGGLN